MTVYVDELIWEWRGQLWCHMYADTFEELHRMAEDLGLKRSWFQDKPGHPHYDIVRSKREKAIALGAVAQTIDEAVDTWDSGLEGWR